MARAADFQVYGLKFAAVAPAAVQNQVLTFDASSNFMWYYASWSAYNVAGNTAWTEATRQIPAATVLITPGDTNTQLMNLAVPIGHFFGSGEMPFVLPAPREIPARSTLAFLLTNLDSAITYDIYLSLIGVKRYLGG